jgi:hypothetical protein
MRPVKIWVEATALELGVVADGNATVFTVHRCKAD